MDGDEQPQAGDGALPDFLVGGGAMGDRIRSHDWASTPLGHTSQWPQSLRAAASIMLNSRYPIALYWGRELTLLYNDAWSPIPGGKHPRALGRPARDVWPEIWNDIEPLFARVHSTGEGTWSEDQLLPMYRHGFTEECYFNFTFSPVRGERGRIDGIFNAVVETTDRVLGERRLRTLSDLGARMHEARDAEEACVRAAGTLGQNDADVPFALIYLVDPDGVAARLAAVAGLPADHPAASSSVRLDADDSALPWPLARALATRETVVVDVGVDLRGGRWNEPLRQVVVLPLAAPGEARSVGVVVAGVNPRQRLDARYRSFFDLLAGHVATAIGNARAFAAERKRSAALAEIDRAKTAFFSNASHEFRTPLTLMLAPLADALANPAVTGRLRAEIELVHRNGLRLLKLVNSLLDFARIEAGRAQATFAPVDLAALTQDLASSFRSAMDRAGLVYEVVLERLDAPVYVDADLWEKIVLNLLSNAFKFTLSGTIRVALARNGAHAVLEVADTGVGIPQEELPHLFERFHRVEGVRGRTHEGTGIGLALVYELVKLHGGSIAAESTEGAGTTFRISLPFGAGHLPAERVRAARTQSSTATGAQPYVQEALRWLPEVGDDTVLEPVLEPALSLEVSDATALGQGARILLADDNADMRDYLKRLLGGRFEVHAVNDGVAALDALRTMRPDLVISDVMMPNLDGFGLVRRLRENPATADIPVILLSARAGEEATLEGLDAGADDYLTKPFSSRELLARAGAQIERSRLQRALRVADERLSLALHGAQMLAWEWDPRSDRLAVGETAAQLFGLPPSSRIRSGAELLALVHFDDRDRYRANRLEALSAGATYRARFRILRPVDGATAWLEETGAARTDPRSGTVDLLGVTMDVTDRVRAEEAVRQSEMRFRSFADSAPALLWTTEPDGRCSFLSRGWYDFTGQSEAEGLDFGWLDAVHPDDRTKAGEMFAAANERREPFELEYRLRRADGEYRWAIDAARPRTDESGAFVGFIGSVIEIHERKRAEEERAALLERERAARAEAERASVMKDEFLATLSHELRTPLNAIVGWSHLLNREGGTEGDARQGLAAIERNARVQARMIEDLLDMSRIVSGKVRLDVQRVNLADVIEQSIQAVMPSANARSIRLLKILDPRAGPVTGDPNRLEQIVWNLLSNAIKFTPKGGKVQVVLERVNSHLEIVVSDNGEGISAEFLPYVFDRFRQADASTTRRHGGLGLGLNIAKQLAELHGGRIEARSAGKDQGATFVVTLPLAPALHDRPQTERRHPRAEPAEAPRLEMPRLAGVKVLVVDDDADARLIIERILAAPGAEVVSAASAAEALTLLKSERPDVLLSDIGMPYEDGYDLIRWVRALPAAEGGQTPAIAFTAFARSEDRRRALLSGYQMHVAKPVDEAELLAVVASLCGRLPQPQGATT